MFLILRPHCRVYLSVHLAYNATLHAIDGRVVIGPVHNDPSQDHWRQTLSSQLLSSILQVRISEVILVHAIMRSIFLSP